MKYDGKVCSVFCLSGEKYFKPDNNSSFGAGVDLILDYSMNERITEFSDTIVPFTNNFKAVSYTHLRAHETVLDLVCRRLPEKKKRK